MGYRSLKQYERELTTQRMEAFDRIKGSIREILNNCDDELDQTLVELVYSRDKDIARFVDSSVTIRDFLETLLDHKSIEISDTVAREEIIELVCKRLNAIKRDCVRYDDLMDAYLLFPTVYESLDSELAKRKLYESIMKSVAVQVKKALGESLCEDDSWDEEEFMKQNGLEHADYDDDPYVRYHNVYKTKQDVIEDDYDDC